MLSKIWEVCAINQLYCFTYRCQMIWKMFKWVSQKLMQLKAMRNHSFRILTSSYTNDNVKFISFLNTCSIQFKTLSFLIYWINKYDLVLSIYDTSCFLELRTHNKYVGIRVSQVCTLGSGWVILPVWERVHRII